MFKPCNRYLLIERGTTNAQEDLIIALPEGSFKAESRYEKVKVLALSSEVRPPVAVGDEIVVLSHMIEEVDFGSGLIYLVMENHVLGTLE